MPGTKPKLYMTRDGQCLCGSNGTILARGLCSRCYTKQRRKDGKGSKHTVSDHRSALLGRYGLTLDEYAAMFLAQNGVCAICGQSESRSNQYGPNSLAVDHNHETGELRGLLCSRCNVALGLFKDDENLLLSALAYLTNRKEC